MITKKCSQCGKDFVLNDGEIAFYKKKKLHLPNRCKDCRKANKLKKKDELKEVNNTIDNKLREKVEEPKLTRSIDDDELLEERPSHGKKRNRKFTLLVIGLIILLFLSIYGLDYLSNQNTEQSDKNQTETLNQE